MGVQDRGQQPLAHPCTTHGRPLPLRCTRGALFCKATDALELAGVGDLALDGGLARLRALALERLHDLLQGGGGLWFRVTLS